MKLLINAQKYQPSNSPDKFLEEAAPLLTDAQKMCILTNLCDSLYLMVMQTQQVTRYFYKFMQGFGIAEERFQPYFEVLVLKNDRTVFTNDDLQEPAWLRSQTTHLIMREASIRLGDFGITQNHTCRYYLKLSSSVPQVLSSDQAA